MGKLVFKHFLKTYLDYNVFFMSVTFSLHPWNINFHIDICGPVYFVNLEKKLLLTEEIFQVKTNQVEITPLFFLGTICI